MKRLVDKKDKKALAIAVSLLVVLLFLSIMMVIGLSNIRQLTVVKEQSLTTSLNAEWDYIYARITENYTRAQLQSEDIKTNIVNDILDEYLDKKELKEDLTNVSRSDKMVEILGVNIKDVYLNSIINDANDPFILSSDMVLSDLSIDCSANERVRDFDTEASMHFNKYLVKDALDNIVKQKQKQTFWCFAPVDEGYPWYHDVKDMRSMTMDELKNLFIKYRDVNVLDSFEFISTAYIFTKEDVAGTPVVGYNGEFNDAATQLFVNSGFNIIDIIENNPEDSMVIYGYEKSIEEIERDYSQSLDYSYTMMILECIAFLITLISVPYLQHRILDRG